MCKQKGFNIFCQAIAYPPLIKEAGKYKKYYAQNGIDLTFGPFCGEYDGKLYPDAYSETEIEALRLNKTSDSGIRHFYQKGHPCNAGYNAVMVDIYGNIRSCAKEDKVIGNIYRNINFTNKLILCPFERCYCPLNSYDLYLFEKAMKTKSL
jgi:hypothetical protein